MFICLVKLQHLLTMLFGYLAVAFITYRASIYLERYMCQVQILILVFLNPHLHIVFQQMDVVEFILPL